MILAYCALDSVHAQKDEPSHSRNKKWKGESEVIRRVVENEHRHSKASFENLAEHVCPNIGLWNINLLTHLDVKEIEEGSEDGQENR